MDTIPKASRGWKVHLGTLSLVLKAVIPLLGLPREVASNAKNFLQVGDRVVGVVAGNPKLCAAASQQSTKVLCINQNACIYCQGDHSLGSSSTIEIPFKPWIAIHLMKKVIQRIQQW